MGCQGGNFAGRRRAPAVQVLSSDPGGDEGTAMLEIVHDCAPDAILSFRVRRSIWTSH